MGLIGKFFRSIVTSIDWTITASTSELEDGYEKRRRVWLKKGGGDKTREMEKINRELSKRNAKEWEKDPRRSKDPNFRWTDANRWDKD